MIQNWAKSMAQITLTAVTADNPSSLFSVFLGLLKIIYNILSRNKIVFFIAFKLYNTWNPPPPLFPNITFNKINQLLIAVSSWKIVGNLKFMEHRYGAKDFVTSQDCSYLLPGAFYLTKVDSLYRRFYAKRDTASTW